VEEVPHLIRWRDLGICYRAVEEIPVDANLAPDGYWR
jgi:hypothetical protein